jgi:hypothetical protein
MINKGLVLRSAVPFTTTYFGRFARVRPFGSGKLRPNPLEHWLDLQNLNKGLDVFPEQSVNGLTAATVVADKQGDYHEHEASKVQARYKPDSRQEGYKDYNTPRQTGRQPCYIASHQTGAPLQEEKGPIDSTRVACA